MAKRKEAWQMRVAYLDSCNCDWGCPCQFNARPTHGSCEGIGGVHIFDGHYGDIRLDRLNLLFALSYPGAVHEGHGRGSYYIDERSTDEQFGVLSEMMKGKLGGPFAFYASTLEEHSEPRKAKIVFSGKGIHSTVEAVGIAQAQLEPIRNPITGKVHRVTIELPSGVEANRMDQASLKKGYIRDGYLSFESSGTYGSISEAIWKGP